ncbi:MAG: 50S ribosomal protein L29 [Patescibacteria group bacterium]
MKKNDLNKQRSKSLKELGKLVEDKKLDLIKTKAKTVASREKNLKKAKNLKHDIAQILTIIKESQLVEKEKE